MSFEQKMYSKKIFVFIIAYFLGRIKYCILWFEFVDTVQLCEFYSKLSKSIQLKTLLLAREYHRN